MVRNIIIITFVIIIIIIIITIIIIIITIIITFSKYETYLDQRYFARTEFYQVP